MRYGLSARRPGASVLRPTRAVVRILLAGLVGATVELHAGGLEYSTAPLTQAPIMSTAEVAVDLVRFNNWLVEQTPPRSEGYPPIREHAYLLVDSILKIRKSEGRETFNDFERVSLATLFNFANGLGVYGSGLVAREFSGASDRKTFEPLLPKTPTQLQFQFPYFELSSSEARWRVRFPYYFMLWQTSHFTAKNGFLTDMAILSTSFSKHDNGPGASQATIMFIYSPKADCAVFDRSWLELLGIDRAAKTAMLLLPGSQNFYAYDSKTNMHNEVTFVPDVAGCYALAYSGLGGPFQSNRLSYLDFIKSLDTTQRASDSEPQRPVPASEAER